MIFRCTLGHLVARAGFLKSLSLNATCRSSHACNATPPAAARDFEGLSFVNYFFLGEVSGFDLTRAESHG